MAIPLTPKMVAAAYSYLRTTPPFNRWRLPPAEEVRFKVLDRIRDPGYVRIWGDHVCHEGKHIIRVSRSLIPWTSSLMELLAHEMIHVHQAESGAKGRPGHGPGFQRLAARVCSIHGFDPGRF
jgi:hypothetical protein